MPTIPTHDSLCLVKGQTQWIQLSSRTIVIVLDGAIRVSTFATTNEFGGVPIWCVRELSMGQECHLDRSGWVRIEASTGTSELRVETVRRTLIGWLRP